MVVLVMVVEDGVVDLNSVDVGSTLNCYIIAL